MRTQGEREEVTLDIASALFGSALLWLLVVLATVLMVELLQLPESAMRAALLIAAPSYVATIVWRLVPSRQDPSQS